MPTAYASRVGAGDRLAADRGEKDLRLPPRAVRIGLPVGGPVAEDLRATQRDFRRSPADPKLQPSAADQVGSRGFLGEVQRVLIPHVDDGGADLDPARLRGNCRQQRQRRGQLPLEVMDADERPVDAEVLRRLGQFDGLQQRVGGSASLRAGGRAPVAERQEADLLHAHLSIRCAARIPGCDSRPSGGPGVIVMREPDDKEPRR